MPIPPFDARGNLSVGQLFGPTATSLTSLVPCTLAELHDRFVQGGDPGRARIWHGWMRHRQLLDAFPVPYLTLVDGSFTTSKREPGDVDLCILFEAEVANGMPPANRAQLDRLMDRDTAKRQYMLDLYWVAVYHFVNPRFPETTLRNLTYWTRVFGIDRLGHQKSILAVTGGGVL